MYRFLILLFSIGFAGLTAAGSGEKESPVQWTQNSVLNKGKWVKIRTQGRGIYKITYDKLKTWGFTDPGQVNVYGNGGFKLTESLDEQPSDDLLKNRSWRGKDGSGKDALFFYSGGTVSWKRDPGLATFSHSVNPYSDFCFYFLSQEGGGAQQVETVPPVTEQSSHTVTAFDEYQRYETEQYNLIKSGQQWFGEKFGRSFSRTVTLNCPDQVSQEPAIIKISGAGRSSSVSSLEVTINQVRQLPLIFNAVNVDSETTLYADEKQYVYPVSLNSPAVEINFLYNATNALSDAWLDFITVNRRRQLKMNGDELFFRDTRSVGDGNVSRFIVENGVAGMKIWDITVPDDLFEVPSTLQGNQVVFTRPSSVLREYVAFKTSGNFPEPVFVGEVPNQDLHALQVPELLIISHPDFLESAEKVAVFHRETDNMDVEVVPVNQIYNEFGSGSPDATAIRNFIRMCRDRSNKIKYVLLFGDGSYDNRNIGGTNRNFIPAFQSENSLVPTSSFVSDDYFVILDSGESVYNGLMDLGIGRLPVSTPYEAGVVTGKIVNYYSPESLGLWRSNLCFIGDDGDGNLHMADSESLTTQVNDTHREFQTEKIYLDAWPQITTPGGERYPGVMDAINQQVKNGVLILNYVGHANTRFMADERVLDVSSINAWSNRNNLPIFVTATCEFSRFDADETSAGEYILLNPNGGGIGLFSTTRMVYAYSNFLLSRNFYRYVFEKDAQGENFRMGDIMRLAKINTVNTVNKRSFTLLADPALRLSYPKYRIVTRSINAKDAQTVADTLKALARVTVAGDVTDHFGNKLTAFNGEVTAVVYDKPVTQKTLGNAGESPFLYKLQNSIIYKGEATVKSGEFSFSFVIPKDISYSLGNGKILYYAQDGTQDAHGAFENFLIGGSAGNQLQDNKPPVVNLYLDNTSFRNGDETSRNPLLLAEVMDENGINTVGTGIGHDITAILDGDYTNVLVLNDYYQAAKDDYTKGTIRYPFRNLAVGEHTLILKVWDVANNSTQTEIKFVVTSDFYISETYTVPNPVKGYTNLFFTHNQPDGVFKTLVEIFDVTGTRVDHFQTSVSSTGTQSNPVRWDMGERGVSLRSGLYLYRITIRSAEGELAAKSGKFLILH